MDLKKGIDLAANVAAPGVGMASKAGSGMASWVSYIGASDVVNSMKDPGFILFVIAGLMHFFGYFFLGNALRIYVGIIFLISAIFFIQKGNGIVFVIIYWIFNTSFGSNWKNLSFWLIVITVYFLWGVFFGRESIAPDIIGGIVILLIFYIDFGLLSLLVVKLGFPLTQLVKNLITLTPWWALYGLFTTKGQSTSIAIFKYIAIIYIFIVIIMGATTSSGIQNNIPGLDEIDQARTDINLQIGVQNVSPAKSAWSNIKCLFSEPQDVKTCQRREQAKLQCDKLKKIDEEEYNECIDRIVNPEKYKELEGAQDRSIDDYIRFSLESPYLGNRKEIESYEQNVNFGTRIELDSPKYPINILSKCYFEYTNKTGKKHNITGIVVDNFGKSNGKQGTSLIQEKQDGPFDLLCELSEEGKKEIIANGVKGNAKMIMKSTASNLQNIAELKQYFLNKQKLNADLSEEARRTGSKLDTYSKRQSAILKIYPEIATTYPNRKVISKSTPGFASPILQSGTSYINEYEPGQRVLLAMSVKNNDKGKVIKINKLQFIPPPGFTIDCGHPYDTQGNYLLANKITADKFSMQNKQIRLASCFLSTQNLLKTIPTINNNPVPLTFYANMNYDYELSYTHQFRIIERAIDLSPNIEVTIS